MYAKYTGFFRTRRENHNLIKFSPFLGKLDFDFLGRVMTFRE
nr:MAG TPA: hypothetical protein [Caudoviricetes sp.]